MGSNFFLKAKDTGSFIIKMRPVCQIKSYELDPHGFGELLTNE